MTDQELIENETQQNQEEQNTEDAPFDLIYPDYLAVVYIRKVKPEEGQENKERKCDIEIGCGLRLDISENITPIIRLSKDGHPEFIKDGYKQETTVFEAMTIAEYSWFSDVEINYPEFEGCREIFNKGVEEGAFPVSAKEELKTKRSIYEDPDFRGVRLNALKQSVEWGSNTPNPSDGEFGF
ncbi:hypothetical protein KDZ19_09255 [Lactobacillus crispatus]|uniref:hypothetical protein n=1 Tax=Lactobacillus crispatus TaxID=47770 RepID=UPI001C4DE600|nr:hypothetical protein [Lactobacillus crispatus]MBW0458576.1 hypothetical protein [Lactobacillus crispatus]